MGNEQALDFIRDQGTFIGCAELRPVFNVWDFDSYAALVSGSLQGMGGRLQSPPERLLLIIYAINCH